MLLLPVIALTTWTIICPVKAGPVLPIVDKGVFVITGVRSCNSGLGYCVLGSDCTVDKEFDIDLNGGHCDGLRKAFTPRAYFSCCRFVTADVDNSTGTMNETTGTTHPPSIESSVENSSISGSSSSESSPESISSSSSSEVESATLGTTTIIYEEKTEISVEESISLQLGSCGQLSSKKELRIGGVYLDEILDAGYDDDKPTTCWTAAIVRQSTNINQNQHLSTDPGSFLCSGAILNHNTILTTATCASRLMNQDLDSYAVVLNSRHLIHPSKGPNVDGVVRRIDRVIVHELYGVQGNKGSRVNDVGLVLLRGGDTTGEGEVYCSVCLEKLSAAESATGQNISDCIVSGYSHPSEATESDGLLHEAEQTLISCNDETLGGQGVLCAAGKESAEACFSPRDSGSPLACRSTPDSAYSLYGLFSSGFHCGSKLSPVNYTEVRFYLDWIRRQLGK